MSGLPFSASVTAIDFVLLSELGGDVKDFVFLADPCLLPTLILVIVLNRSAGFDECCLVLILPKSQNHRMVGI